MYYIGATPITIVLRWSQSVLAKVFMVESSLVRPQNDQALISALQVENAQLKELLGRSSATPNSILATVLVRPPKSPYDTIIVDRGERDGIRMGMIAYGAPEYAIGRVTEAKERTALITLFSSSNQKETVLIGNGASSTPALAEGRGGGNFYIKLPRNVEVNVGDAITWPDSELILLGTIEKIDADIGGTYADIYFKSPIDIHTLRYVQLKEEL